MKRVSYLRNRRVAKSQIVVVVLLIIINYIIRTLLLGLRRKKNGRPDEHLELYISIKTSTSELMNSYIWFINDGQANYIVNW